MLDSKKIVVYTCVTGIYDKLKQPYTHGDNVEYVCFTNRPKKVPNGWRTVPYASPTSCKNGHNINRFHKIFPHLLFPDNQYSIYMDGNIEYKADILFLADQFKTKGVGIGAFRHNLLRTVASEAEECRSCGKFNSQDLQRYKHQLAYYQQSGFDLSTPISANYFLVRDHSNIEMQNAMSLLWSQISKFTRRDQLCLQFVLWQMNVPFIFLDEIDQLNAGDLIVNPHRFALFKEQIPNYVKRRALKLVNMIAQPRGH